ncbi:hypothetical protein PMAYCL1PPCAC_26507 [Pristionchus mayeri]|uniref:Uncharacterized protein n=1 Tax=Pristionchus mayeri TaxID=1317129 RepID=A0AAN5D597_9BILA|nr:hypothetical protein PMAYCL1PPCAC_26507 [Pristionchus mayeri]
MKAREMHLPLSHWNIRDQTTDRSNLEQVVADADLLTRGVRAVGVRLVPGTLKRVVGPEIKCQRREKRSTISVPLHSHCLHRTATSRECIAQRDISRCKEKTKNKNKHSLMIGAFLRHAEQLRLVCLISTVIITIAEVGRLQIQICWCWGTGCARRDSRSAGRDT